METFSIEAAPTSTTPSSTTFPSKLRISFILVASILFGLTTTVRGSLFFWFCRTLIRCDVENGNYTNTTNTTNIITNNNTEHPLWSGSPICNDHEYVAKEAQFLSTTSSVLSTLLALLCVPALGALSDHCGRKWMLVVGSCGTLLSSMSYLFAAEASRSGYDHSAYMLVLLGTGANGALGVFGSTVITMIVDTFVTSRAKKETSVRSTTEAMAATGEIEEEDSNTEDEMGKFIGWFQAIKAVGTGIGVGLSGYFIQQNLKYYSGTWTAMVLPSIICTVLTCFAPETLPPKKLRGRGSIVRRGSITKLEFEPNPLELLNDTETETGEEEVVPPTGCGVKTKQTCT